MKRAATLLALIILMLAGLSPALAAADAPRAQTLVVGHTTMMNGNFFADLWGNNTADIDVRSLIHEYPLIAWTNAGDYQVNNTVVRSLETQTQPNGDKTYIITLRRGLAYCDGSPITAKDFIFTTLLLSSPQVRKLAGVVTQKDYLLGFDQYTSGQDKAWTGIRLLDEYSYSLTVGAKHLPYYFELNYINSYPLPYQVIAPGCDIADEGNGVLITGPFSADLLRGTLLAPQTGYISHAKVTSGPYMLTKYDEQTHVAEFAINPHYKGNYENQVPSIPKLIFREIKNPDIISQLQNGQVDLVNKVTEGQVIDDSLALSGGGAFAVMPYPRTGSGFLAIACERPVTASVKVRQAIAHCLDYRVLPRDFLKGYGEPIYGYYGLGQWMAQAKRGELAAMKHYSLDIKAALDLLRGDGWVLNQKGEAFKAKADQVRYRKNGQELQPLHFVMAVTPQNKAANMVVDMLRSSLPQVGASMEVITLPMDQALRQYYRQEERQYDLLFMGTNFTYLFDPADTYLVGEQYQGTQNTSGLQDPKLAQLARKMTEHRPGDRAAYLNRWMEFQRYWAQVLPMIPLYSNTYHDVYTSKLVGYFPQHYWNWGTAILYAMFKP